MIDLGTIAGLLEHDHGLAAYRPLCDLRAVLPLAQMVAEGKRPDAFADLGAVSTLWRGRSVAGASAHADVEW